MNSTEITIYSTILKNKVNYGNMNNQKYESNDISNDPELILQTIDNLQSEGFSRNAKKMLLTDKLLRTINRIKSPSISSIYNQGFEKDSRDTEITTAQQNVFKHSNITFILVAFKTNKRNKIR